MCVGSQLLSMFMFYMYIFVYVYIHIHICTYLDVDRDVFVFYIHAYLPFKQHVEVPKIEACFSEVLCMKLCRQLYMSS